MTVKSESHFLFLLLLFAAQGVTDPLKDYLSRALRENGYLEAYYADDKLIYFDLDLNGDGSAERLVSLERDRFGKEGNDWAASDYLGIEIQASSHRFSGSTRIYAGLNDLSEFAGCIEGFPSSIEDSRTFEFGTPEPGFAGGYCSVSLHCVDRAGHARLEVVIEDDNRKERMESARFGFPVLAAGVDQFVMKLRQLEQHQKGEAVLEMATLG